MATFTGGPGAASTSGPRTSRLSLWDAVGLTTGSRGLLSQISPQADVERYAAHLRGAVRERRSIGAIVEGRPFPRCRLIYPVLRCKATAAETRGAEVVSIARSAWAHKTLDPV